MKTFHSLDDLEKAVGTHLGYSGWTTVTQHQIDLFAEATGDRQWIHTDPEKAARGPYGATIAHGYLTLSLIPGFLDETVRLDGLSMAVNYGSDKVRYPSVVPVGSRLRGSVELADLQRTSTGARAVFGVTVERDGGDKPACVAEVISLLVV
ncbi:MaoC family dehydratase [Actinomadura keratinilytica]|jgi:acyl dehydratase|uniref:MaoC family dehydratase n=1 Tax=Actinomadura keratinilytica TaxID=547461 RepID=A0ABP7Z6D1_9ACTN